MAKDNRVPSIEPLCVKCVRSRPYMSGTEQAIIEWGSTFREKFGYPPAQQPPGLGLVLTEPPPARARRARCACAGATLIRTFPRRYDNSQSKQQVSDPSHILGLCNHILVYVTRRFNVNLLSSFRVAERSRTGSCYFVLNSTL